MIQMSYRLFGDKTVSILCNNNTNILSTIKRKVEDIWLFFQTNCIQISSNELKQEIESFGTIYHNLLYWLQRKQD